MPNKLCFEKQDFFEEILDDIFGIDPNIINCPTGPTNVINPDLPNITTVYQPNNPPNQAPLPVPEPGTYILFAIGIIMTYFLAKKQNSKIAMESKV